MTILVDSKEGDLGLLRLACRNQKNNTSRKTLGRGVVLIETKDNQFLEEETKHLREENGILRNQNKDYSLLKRHLAKAKTRPGCDRQKRFGRSKKSDQKHTDGSGESPLPDVSVTIFLCC